MPPDGDILMLAGGCVCLDVVGEEIVRRWMVVINRFAFISLKGFCATSPEGVGEVVKVEPI